MAYISKNNQLIENTTGQVVFKTDIQDELRSMCRTLNLGGGFNGFTPSFFCYDYSITKKSPDELTTF